jgi:hypothetical protein
VAARGCGGRGPYANSMLERSGVEVRQGRAAEYNRGTPVVGDGGPKPTDASREANGTVYLIASDLAYECFLLAPPDEIKCGSQGGPCDPSLPRHRDST